MFIQGTLKKVNAAEGHQTLYHILSFVRQSRIARQTADRVPRDIVGFDEGNVGSKGNSRLPVS